jgi:hypothetical protein
MRMSKNISRYTGIRVKGQEKHKKPEPNRDLSQTAPKYKSTALMLLVVFDGQCNVLLRCKVGARLKLTHCA